LSEAKGAQIHLSESYRLTPGTYKVDVVVRDVSSGSRGIRTLGFTVPRYEAEEAFAFDLDSGFEAVFDERDATSAVMFVIGSAKVIPNLSGVYKRGQEVGIYMQIYNAGIDQTTLRPAVDVRICPAERRQRSFPNQKEDWQGLSDSGQRLTISQIASDDRAMPFGELRIEG
jgi:hypothetical protein